MPGHLRSPGTRAGDLSPSAAALFGLRVGTPISVAIIDAHAGVAGAGASDAGTAVLVLGTSACHMVNSRTDQSVPGVPGVAGIVQDGILPGFFGYETGQAAVGDALEWVTRTCNSSHEELTKKAVGLPPGSGGVTAIDWLNGCRTPLMDSRVSGAMIGLTLSTRPEQIYRAMIEATAFGLRWICETLRDAGVPIDCFVAAGGLPIKSPLLMQIYADVLGEDISLASTDQSVALGAAILGTLAAGPQASGHQTFTDAIHAMAPLRPEPTYRPDPERHHRYLVLYDIYRKLTARDGTLAQAMREIRMLQ
jgi:L-ribulokinase